MSEQKNTLWIFSKDFLLPPPQALYDHIVKDNLENMCLMLIFLCTLGSPRHTSDIGISVYKVYRAMSFITDIRVSNSETDSQG